MIGLTKEQVEDRRSKGQINEEVGAQTPTVKEIVKGNVLTFFNLLYTVLAILLILVGAYKDLSFLFIIVANTGIGIIQELRSKATLDKLKLLKAGKVNVFRDGKEVWVKPTNLVLDDAIILTAGSQIPADALVLDGDLSVNEALLTGESEEISKSAGDELLSGSFVVSGRAIARLTAVGRDSFSSKLTIEATKHNGREESKLIKSLNLLVKIVGICLIPIGIILLIQHYFVMKIPFSESVSSMVAAVLGMIPDGLYLMASVAMAVATMRLAKKEVLVQSMKSIESLARVNVLCIDKTGTITEPNMEVARITFVDKGNDEGDIRRLLGDFVASQAADNITMEALKRTYKEIRGRKALNTCPFSSLYKYSSVEFEDCNVVLGAPEYVLGASLAMVEDELKAEEAEGYRVLAIAVTKEFYYGNRISGKVLPLALISLTNPIREGAEETFGFFAKNGVDIKVLSGDNALTVSSIAKKAGIAGAENYIDGRKLNTKAEIEDAAEKYTVFGRVTPKQKKAFVAALKKQGKTVAMTGDGVNDILAMKDADCSIAMASGAEAASNAAQMVLLDSNFTKMPSIVAEGRRLVNNIENTATLYLSKNIFTLLLALFSVFNLVFYPLKPSQITLISMFTIGFPSFILALEPNEGLIKGGFFRNVFRVAAPAGITTFISVSSLLLFGEVFKLERSPVSTASALLVALVGFMILIRVSRPLTKIHIAMLLISFGGMAYCTLFKSQLFGIDPLTKEAAMLLAVFLIATEGIFRYAYGLRDFVVKWLSRYKMFKKYVDDEGVDLSRK